MEIDSTGRIRISITAGEALAFIDLIDEQKKEPDGVALAQTKNSRRAELRDYPTDQIVQKLGAAASRGLDSIVSGADTTNLREGSKNTIDALTQQIAEELN